MTKSMRALLMGAALSGFVAGTTASAMAQNTGGDKAGTCSGTPSTFCLVNTDCPAGQTCTLPTNEGYGAEAKWSVDSLKAAGVLQSGHIYRFQFMVHDGDQNKVGGDVGEACVNIAIPEHGLPACP